MNIKRAWSNEDGSIKLFNGDCLDVMDLLIENGIKVDTIICDLPYGTTWAKWDSIINFDELWSRYNKIIKDNGAIVLFSSQPFTTKLIASNIKDYKYTWYWIKNNKGNFLNAKRQPMRQLEEINVFKKHNYYPQGLTINESGVGRSGGCAKHTMTNYSKEWKQEFTGYPSNILHYDVVRKGLHPTEKPVDLLEYLVKTYTKEGDVVLDNCMGVGSTGVACENLNRKFIGIELDEKYFDIAVDRISKDK
ncbi:MAG: DNA-methyltransferase [Paraclostridium sp.]